MDLTLTEVLGVLLRAEDESGKRRDSAKREAEEVMRRAQARFARDREARLKAARSDALAQIESARKSAEMEALHIAEMGRRGRERMRENYDRKAPALIARMAEDIAARYASRGD